MALYHGKAEFEQGVHRSTLPRISCPECGVATVARDDGFLCLDCVRATYDWRAPLEEHLKKHPKLLALRRCKECERVETSLPHEKTRRWEGADRDTEELLAVLLRRVKAQLFGKKALDLVDGLSAGLKAGDPLSLRDARLVWTEPHSRRLKLEIDVAHASVRQRLLLEFVEESCKCADCAGEARERRNAKMGKGGGDFGTRVQIRAAHCGACPRTMRSLEDAIRAIGKAGLMFQGGRLPKGKGWDVDFNHEKDGERFVDELRRASRAPLRIASKTKKLITHDPKANTVEYQRTILLEVPPISKWDLVVKAPRGGGKPALYLVASVRRELRLVRVDRGEAEEVNGEQYFRKPFESVASADALIDLQVVDTVPLDDASVLVVRHEGDDVVKADASRLPLGSRTTGAVVRAYDVDSIVGADVDTNIRYVLVAPGRKADASDSTTTASTMLSHAQRRRAKRRENSESVASDAPTERDFDEIEFRELLDQPDTIPEDEDEEDVGLERLRLASEDSEALDAEFFGK